MLFLGCRFDLELSSSDLLLPQLMVPTQRNADTILDQQSSH